MQRITKQEQDEARAQLRKLLKPGQTVYCILRHVSRSGMFRVIDLCIVTKDGIRNIGWLAARAGLGAYDRDRNGVKVGGCGMDMGFHLVYELGGIVWPKGTRKPHSTRNGQPDTDGGYALRKEWL